MKSKKQSPSFARAIALGVIFAVAILIVAAIVVGVRALMPRAGEMSGQGNDGWINAIKGLGQVALDPKAGFPGKDRINILCMGIDDNWTDSDVVYTRGARTDTLFMLSLDLANKKAAILSIPRDADAAIAGTNYRDKINAAYASGGPKRSVATVANMIGVVPDYYIVLKIDGTKTMVNALGGVDVNVEHQMDYDDNWGHLHVHLKPGFQHLNGDDAVAFARYRHGNSGINPEDGDPRRMYRQHVLVRAMLDRIKSAGNLIKPDSLIDTVMTCIHTNLSRTQLFDLGAIYHNVNQDDIQTAQIPGSDSHMPNGAYIMKLDDAQMNLLVDWLLKGDESAGRQVTPVTVKNATKTTGLAASAAETLKAGQYTNVRVGKFTKPGVVTVSAVVDTGVANRSAAKEVAALLGLPPQAVSFERPKPNKRGWTPPASITVTLGSDYAAKSPAPVSAPTAAESSTSAP